MQATFTFRQTNAITQFISEANSSRKCEKYKSIDISHVFLIFVTSTWNFHWLLFVASRFYDICSLYVDLINGIWRDDATPEVGTIVLGKNKAILRA